MGSVNEENESKVRSAADAADAAAGDVFVHHGKGFRF